MKPLMINDKKVLIYDEAGFSRICSAILETDGCGTYIIDHLINLQASLNGDDVGLVVTSYPYGAFLLDEVKKRKIPAIILTDGLDGRLIAMLNELTNSYCMIKPLNYDKFKGLVKNVLNGEDTPRAGYSIV
jgi:DNA-binding NtrC family response regulator